MHQRIPGLAVALVLASLLGGCSPSSSAPVATASPAPLASPTLADTPGRPPQGAPSAKEETATFAGGCFWAMQTEFEKLRGVNKVTAGYSGGTAPHPSYEQVCTGTTGHAETVQIVFDPAQISYEELVHIFLTAIDPTTKDRQGNDKGTQYRSAIFFHDPAQEASARKVIAEIDKARLYSQPIVTEVDPYQSFYDAEAYHQDYFAAHPNQGYCAAVVAPEVNRFVQMNRARLK